MTVAYEEFLETKLLIDEPSGFTPEMPIHPKLFDFQRDITTWALQRGKAALFEDCGLGKTFQQLEWARHVAAKTGHQVLIFAPLAVSMQTVREGLKIDIDVNICTSNADMKNGVNVTNYEKLHHFTPEGIGGIVLDESSILKGFDGKYRKLLTEFARGIPFRLACTATPAPNDLIELLNHAEFLGVMSGKEIIALFFQQDGNTTHKWRLKYHATSDFWRWMASWSIAIRKPSDLGYEDGDFSLPELRIHQHVVNIDETKLSTLFPMDAQTLQERRQARRESLHERVALCAEIANASDEPWITWCDLNVESKALRKVLNGAIEITGSDKTDFKESALIGFADGDNRVLVTKPSIAGHGMNFQHCCKMAFVGLSDSYEQLYQGMRRCWRFGQKKPVDVHIITSEREGAVKRNILRKEKQATEMYDEIVKHMKGFTMEKVRRNVMEYKEGEANGKSWTLKMGDSVKRITEIESESIGLSVFSPPFPGMYAYTNSPSDMGNVKDMAQMIAQYKYLIPELLRILMPGRSCCVHLTQGVAFKGTDGYIGVKDFRGAVIQAMEEGGFIYYGEVCIDKDPQVKAIRTKDAGLLFKSLAKDSARMHMALADYVLQFRKPGDNPEPINAGISERYNNMDGWITANEWIEWAAPVWYRKTKHYPGGIKETEVLKTAPAKDEKDEKHICPLQLGVIERCVKLWSNPGDTVFSPFAGIGSEGYQSLAFNRKFIGIELKESYYKTAINNLKTAEMKQESEGLFNE